MGLFIAGPALLTLFWLSVVIWMQRVSVWLLVGEFAFSIAALLLSMALFRVGAGASMFGSMADVEYPPSFLGQLAGTCGFYIFMNSLSGILWCFVLTMIALPVDFLLARRQGHSLELVGPE